MNSLFFKNLRSVLFFALLFQSVILFAEDVYPYKGFFAWPKNVNQLNVLAGDGFQKILKLSPNLEYVSTGTSGNSRKSILFYSGRFPMIRTMRCLLPKLGQLEQDFKFDAILGKTRSFKITVPAGATVFGLCGDTPEVFDEVMIQVFDPSQSIEITFEDKAAG